MDFEAWPAEVDDQAGIEARCPEGIETLRLVTGGQGFGHLELDDEAAVDHEVRVVDADDLASVSHVDRALLLDFMAGKA